MCHIQCFQLIVLQGETLQGSVIFAEGDPGQIFVACDLQIRQLGKGGGIQRSEGTIIQDQLLEVRECLEACDIGDPVTVDPLHLLLIDVAHAVGIVSLCQIVPQGSIREAFGGEIDPCAALDVYRAGRGLPAHEGGGGRVGSARQPNILRALLGIPFHPGAELFIQLGPAAGEFPIAAVVFFRTLLCEGHGVLQGISKIRFIEKPAAPILIELPIPAPVFHQLQGGRIDRKALHRGGHNGHLQRKLPAHKVSGDRIGPADLPVAAPLVVVEGYLAAGQLVELITAADELGFAAVVPCRALLREGHLIGVIVRTDVVAIPSAIAAVIPPAAVMLKEFHGGRQRKALYRGEPDGHGELYLLA